VKFLIEFGGGAQNNVGLKKNLHQKLFWAKQNCGSKQFVGQKKFYKKVKKELQTWDPFMHTFTFFAKGSTIVP
jgi:hypothetical protein